VSTQQPEKPSRYNRSFGGLVGSMIIAVIVVVAFVAVRGLVRESPDVEPEAVDYLGQVGDLQAAGVQVVYPPTLPSGWIATSTDYERGSVPDWSIGVLTDDDEFVGVRQSADKPEDLLHTYVDENPLQGPDVTVPSAVGESWQTWSDEGGDHAYLRTDEATGQTVMVYGSASPEQQESFLMTLTTDPVPDPVPDPA
jgi:hypothetical protein